MLGDNRTVYRYLETTFCSFFICIILYIERFFLFTSVFLYYALMALYACTIYTVIHSNIFKSIYFTATTHLCTCKHL